MKTEKASRERKNDAAPTDDSHVTNSPQSHCCYSHDWPYFKEPVHPYDYSEDCDLEEEWNRKRAAGKAMP